MSVYAPVCVAYHGRSDGGSVMVSADISMQGKTDLLIVQDGTLAAARHVNEILDVYVRPYAGAIGPNFILMDDNARPHRALFTKRYLQTATIERMDWPPKSPDLNPIERAWTYYRLQYTTKFQPLFRFNSLLADSLFFAQSKCQMNKFPELQLMV